MPVGGSSDSLNSPQVSSQGSCNEQTAEVLSLTGH